MVRECSFGGGGWEDGGWKGDEGRMHDGCMRGASVRRDLDGVIGNRDGDSADLRGCIQPSGWEKQATVLFQSREFLGCLH